MHVSPVSHGGPVIALDPGDIVVPINAVGRWVGAPRALQAQPGGGVAATWSWDELAIGEHQMIGFAAFIAEAGDIDTPGAVAFYSWAAATLAAGDGFAVHDYGR